MDEVQIVGLCPYSFTNENGEILKGITYHVSFISPSSRYGFVGHEVKTFSVSETIVSSWSDSNHYVPNVGDKVLVVYNRYGKINYFQQLSK